MGNEDDGAPVFPLQIQQQILHVGTDQRVQRREGFIHQQDGGIQGQSPRQTDPLTHAAGQLIRRAVQIPTEANPLQRLLSFGQALAARDAGYFKPKGCILQRAALRKKGEGLEHHRHVAPPEGTQFASAESLQWSPFNFNNPQAGADQAIDHAQQGGLAGSGQPHHYKDLPGPDLQGDVVYSNPGFRGLKQFGW